MNDADRSQQPRSAPSAPAGRRGDDESPPVAGSGTGSISDDAGGADSTVRGGTGPDGSGDGTDPVGGGTATDVGDDDGWVVPA